MKTIRAKMLVILIPIIIISILATAGSLLSIAKENITQNIIKQNQGETKILAGETGLWLGQFFTMIDSYAKADYKINMDDAGRISLMAQMMKIDSAVTDIYIGTTEGVMLDGSGWTPPADYDPRKRPWYGEALQADKTAYGDPYVDMVTGKVVTSVSSPIKDEGGKVRGVMAADIQLASVTDKINAVKVGETGYAAILTSTGVFVAHPDKTLIGKNGLTDFDADIKGLTQAVIQNDYGSYFYTYKGVKKICTYSAIPNTSWKILITMPVSELTKDITKMTYTLITIAILFITIATVAVIMITNRIAKPIVELNQVTYKLAEGDLTQRAKIKSETEIGHLADSFNLMADNIGALVGGITHLTKDVHHVANEMNASSEKTEEIAIQISQAVNDLANGAEQQSNSVNVSVTRINAMADAIDRISTAIESVYHLTEEINKLVIQGEKSIEVQNKSMVENTKATNSVNEAIHLLDERTKEISQIVSVIDGIASQTNLLALNASIEAARAGEQGRGFSVVADEIRKLAEQSSHSTGRIGDSIKAIVSRTQSAVEQAAVAEKAVAEQEKSVEQVSEIFNVIKDAVVDIKDKFNGVRSGTEGIRDEAENVREAMQEIFSVVELNASGAQEVAASTDQQVRTLAEVSRLASEVEQLASDLQDAVERFKI